MFTKRYIIGGRYDKGHKRKGKSHYKDHRVT